MSRPFQPPSTPGETVDQLRNLHRALEEFQAVAQLEPSATLDEMRAKLNEIIALLAQLTRAGTIRRK